MAQSWEKKLNLVAYVTGVNVEEFLCGAAWDATQP